MIYPVILAGGIGLRLWPLSTQDNPKQILSLTSDMPLVLETAIRVLGDEFCNPLIVTNNDYTVKIQSIFSDYNQNILGILSEPESLNTAAAIALAALYIYSIDPNAVMVVLPSNHYINDTVTFQNMLLSAQKYCDEKNIMTFGILPTHAETEFGYIKIQKNMGNGIFEVSEYIEKPNLIKAQSFYDSNGCYFWNSGIFMGQVGAFLAAFQIYAPDTYCNAKASIETAYSQDAIKYIGNDHFSQCPLISFDHAVMEYHRHVLMTHMTCNWRDLGTIQSLSDFQKMNRVS